MFVVGSVASLKTSIVLANLGVDGTNLHTSYSRCQDMRSKRNDEGQNNLGEPLWQAGTTDCRSIASDTEQHSSAILFTRSVWKDEPTLRCMHSLTQIRSSFLLRAPATLIRPAPAPRPLRLSPASTHLRGLETKLRTRSRRQPRRRDTPRSHHGSGSTAAAPH